MIVGLDGIVIPRAMNERKAMWFEMYQKRINEISVNTNAWHEVKLRGILLYLSYLGTECGG